MPPRGRRPAPLELKLLRGDRKSRINRSAPIPAEVPVKPPRELSSFGRKVWDRLAPDLAAQGVLTHWDVDLFASYCEWASIANRAEADVRKRGLSVTGARGHTIKNPSIQVMRDASKLMLAIGSCYGLTPSDRGRIRLKQTGSPGSRLLSSPSDDLLS